MKKYLIQLTFFLCILIIVYTGTFYLLNLLVSKKIRNQDILILGDSHTEYTSLPNTVNYSLAGAGSVLSYNFLKSFETEIENKLVIIPLGYHNFSRKYQHQIDLDGPRLNILNKRIYSFNMFLRSNINEDWVDFPFSRLLDKEKFTSLFKLAFNYREECLSASFQDTLIYKKTLKEHYNSDYPDHDKVQRKYLVKTVSLLLEKGCNIIMVNTPVVDYYYSNIPESFKKEYESFKDEYKDNSSIRFLDLNTKFKHKLDKDDFLDADHLNKRGVEKMNQYLEGYIKKL